MIKKALLFSFMLMCFTATMWAQKKNMTDEQVLEYVKTANESGKSQKQIMMELASKGVTREQINRIKKHNEGKHSANSEIL